MSTTSCAYALFFSKNWVGAIAHFPKEPSQLSLHTAINSSHSSLIWGGLSLVKPTKSPHLIGGDCGFL
ncbi:MAG: hypothetical protein V7L20_31795 [Nostoc sp.]